MTFQRSILSLSIAALMYGYSGSAMGENAQTDNKPEETIVVLGNKHQNNGAPAGKSEFIHADEFSPSVSNLSELVASTPGAELSGQGGLFQVYALRGMSRWRVLTQIAGVPIHTERRAGTAASFISPWLIEQVEVIKGPISTLYGSGGMAGLTQLTPRHFDGINLQTGYGGSGGVRFENIGWGNDQYSFGLNHRKEKNAQTAKGQTINNHFEQTSASLLGNWSLSNDIDSQLMVIYSRGKDIGKANNEDFETEKYINYPEENHLLGQFALVAEDDWQARFGLHQQDLTTQTTRFGKRINTVQTEAVDYSLSFVKQWQQNDIEGQWGFEQEFRDNIKADENEVSLKSDDTFDYDILDAKQYNAALFASGNYQWSQWTFTLGGRMSYIKQSSGFTGVEHQDRSDNAFTYFASGAYKLNEHWRVTSSVSSGFRFPTVTERFYNGMTARGQTFGNPNLAPEKALNYELGLALNQTDYSLEVNAFSNHIEDYIERINIDDDTRTYQNLDEGTINGVEFGFNHQLNDLLSYQLSGHHLTGEDENGDPIGDISPNKLQVSMNLNLEQWQARLSLKHRFSHDDIASGEQALDSVNLVNANLTYHLSDSWQVSIWADNLLNKDYVLTSDSKSAFAQERQLGLSISWNLN